MKTKLYRVDKMLPTTDDWHPNFERNTVRCSLMQLHDGRFRVCVWGKDDTGMEQNFLLKEDAEAMYNNLPNPIEMKWLLANNFVWC